MFHAALSSHIARPNSDIESETQMGSPRVASPQIGERNARSLCSDRPVRRSLPANPAGSEANAWIGT